MADMAREDVNLCVRCVVYIMFVYTRSNQFLENPFCSRIPLPHSQFSACMIEDGQLSATIRGQIIS